MFNRRLWINSAGALWARLSTTPSEVFWRWDPHPIYNDDEPLLWRLLDKANIGPSELNVIEWAQNTHYKEENFFRRANFENTAMYFFFLQRAQKWETANVGEEFDCGRLQAALARLITLQKYLPVDRDALSKAFV